MSTEYWDRHYHPGRTVRTTEVFTTPKRRGKFSKELLEKMDVAFRKFHPGYMKKCSVRDVRCNKAQVCGFFGECVLTHARTLQRPDLIPELEKAEGLKPVIRILEQIMPSLQRFNVRRNMAPDEEIKT